MSRRTVQRRGVVTAVATAMTASSLGIINVSPAAAAVPAPSGPECTAGGLANGPRNNGDGTMSEILVGGTPAATGTAVILPSRVSSVYLDVCGAEGTDAASGGAAAWGGRTNGTLLVPQGSTLFLVAGSSDGSSGNGGTAGAGGGNGGGYSGVFVGTSADTANAAAIAGGGGGGGGMGVGPFSSGGAGGAGGGTQGQDGAFGSGAKAPDASGGGGGTDTAPGTSYGTPAGQLQGGGGAESTPPNLNAGGGGGGGGWYGGGGGAGGAGADPFFSGGGGGGGGSGYLGAGVTSGSTGANASSGEGVVVVTYLIPTAFTSPQFDDTTKVGQPYNRTITTLSATGTATITIDSGAPPPGITFNDNGDGTATLSGTPTTTGYYPFTLRASNGVSDDDTQSNSITVQQSPTFTSGAPPGGTVGTPYTFTFTVSATPTATITIDSGSPPLGLTFTDNGNNTATLAGTPATAGSFTFTVRAANGVAPDATQQSTVAIVGAPGGGGGETSPSPSPSASTSTSPSPSASTSTSPSPAQVCGLPTVRVNSPTINATGLASVTVFNAPPNSFIELQGYSQNHYMTANFTNDPTPVDRSGIADSNGTITFNDLRPASNTRVRARVRGCAYTGNSAVINVRAQETLQVARNGVRTYTFSGQSIPARPGGLIVNLYRIVGQPCLAGVEPRNCPGEVLIGQDRANPGTDSGPQPPGAGLYSMTLRFPVADAFDRVRFVVKTGRDAQNAPGRSNVRTVLIY